MTVLPLVSFDAVLFSSPQRLAKNLLFPPEEPVGEKPEANKSFAEPLDQKAWIEKSAKYREILKTKAGDNV
jgi:hypothetical protein